MFSRCGETDGWAKTWGRMARVMGFWYPYLSGFLNRSHDRHERRIGTPLFYINSRLIDFAKPHKC